jgi:NADPH-dependent 2,4-dienoyl-CoA reductase/sulfur reductase-like enzyme
MRLLVVGGSDAGISAGLRARELDPDADVSLLVGDRYPNFSICGIPYYVSGRGPDWRNFAHRIDAGLQHGDVVLVVTGVRPDTTLAAGAGADLGIRGAIAVDCGNAHQPARRVRRGGLRAHLPPAARCPHLVGASSWSGP